MRRSEVREQFGIIRPDGSLTKGKVYDSKEEADDCFGWLGKLMDTTGHSTAPVKVTYEWEDGKDEQ